MKGVARAAAPLTLVLDSLNPIPSDSLFRAYAVGYRAVGVYTHVMVKHPEYVDSIFSEHMGIVPICQWLGGPHNEYSGAQQGNAEVARLQVAGCPPEVHAWIDFEEIHDSTSDAISFLDTKSQLIVSGGYRAGLYEAPPEPLTGEESYDRPHITGYWKGAGKVPEPDCGWMMIQGFPVDYHPKWDPSIEIDSDWIIEDYKGRTPMIWWPS